MTAKDLIKFCDPARPHIAQPFTIGEYTYATNGVVAVRVPKIDEVPENPNAPFNVTKLVDNALSAAGGVLHGMPTVPPPNTEPCSHCKGEGGFTGCIDCHGNGYQECDLGHEHTCEKCSGNGRKANPVGEEKCEDCNGSGRVELNTRVPVGDVSFSSKYLRLFAELPGGISILPHGADPALVIFHGGHAIIMPMR